jgi:predicted metalloprotease with PDZ domain
MVKHRRSSHTDDAGAAPTATETVEKVCGEQGGAFRKFFERYVAGTESTSIRLRPRRVTLRWMRRPGIGGRLVGVVGCAGTTGSWWRHPPDGPAHAGTIPGTRSSPDGHRVDEARLAARLSERSPGAAVRVALFRRDELHEIQVPVAEPPPDSLEIAPKSGATTAQAALREAWLNPFQV